MGVGGLDIDCGHVLPWHFDSPNLYRFEVKLLDGKEVADVKAENFGFRTFRLKGNRFCLNGEEVRLPGIEDMPGSNPLYGMAEPHSYMEKTVRLMKDMNSTITRFHWAQDDYRLCLMDSLGMLAQEEISWWQQPHKQLTPTLRETAKRQLAELIEAHYNHPCLFAWGMSNEVSDNQEDIKMMADFARQHDIPSYTLRGYAVTYDDAEGKAQKISLPDLKPGSEQTLTLPNINSGFNFAIVRPDGSAVIRY